MATVKSIKQASEAAMEETSHDISGAEAAEIAAAAKHHKSLTVYHRKNHVVIQHNPTHGRDPILHGKKFEKGPLRKVLKKHGMHYHGHDSDGGWNDHIFSKHPLGTPPPHPRGEHQDFDDY